MLYDDKVNRGLFQENLALRVAGKDGMWLVKKGCSWYRGGGTEVEMKHPIQFCSQRHTRADTSIESKKSAGQHRQKA
jgi:hypothetical protein